MKWEEFAQIIILIVVCAVLQVLQELGFDGEIKVLFYIALGILITLVPTKALELYRRKYK